MANTSTKLCLNPVYKTGDYINTIDELKETLEDPVFGTIPKYSAYVGVGSTYSYNTKKIPYNEMSSKKGSPTKDGSLTVTSTYQLYSWVNGSGTAISGTDYAYLIFLEFYTDNITSYKSDNLKSTKWFDLYESGITTAVKSESKLTKHYWGSDTLIKMADGVSLSTANMIIYKGGDPYQISRRSVRIAFNYSDGAKFSYDSGYSNHITAPLYAWKSYWDYVKLDNSGGGGDTPVETATVSVSLTNATCNIDTGTEYNVGSTLAIIVTPNVGYTFTTAPKFNNVDMSPVGDGSYFVNATITSNNSITGSAVEIERVAITTDYVHCSDDVSVGFSVGDTANITLTCDDGYIFTDFPTINQSGLVYSFSLSEDFKKAYISYKVRGDFSIYAHAILSSENTYGFYAIYEPNDEFLKAFSQNHVYMIGTGTVTEYDLTPFIYNIYKLPFNVENYTNAETVSGVQFYKYTYNVPTKYIPDDDHIFTIDFGVINVPRQFNNDYDYDAQITLETPFFANVSLDAYRVIGGSVHVVGTVNLYERTMYVDVYDKNGTCISETKQQIGYSFPIVTDTFKQTGAYSDELSNSLESARIVVNYDFSIVQISTLIGTVYADDVNLVGFTGTANEREQLESIIKGGINLE